MQSDMLAKCIAISRSHFLNVPYKDLTIDQNIWSRWHWK